jgi:hypothetical protein
MDVKFDLRPELLGYRWAQLRDHEYAGPMLTALAVVLVTYVLYNVRFLCHHPHGLSRP